MEASRCLQFKCQESVGQLQIAVWSEWKLGSADTPTYSICYVRLSENIQYTSAFSVVRYTLNNRRTGSGPFHHRVLEFGFFLWFCQWLLECKRSIQKTLAMRTYKTALYLQDLSPNIVLQLPGIFKLRNRIGKIRLEGLEKSSSGKKWLILGELDCAIEMLYITLIFSSSDRVDEHSANIAFPRYILWTWCT